MDINENYGVAFQIRFETFRFQNPSFARTQNNPFIYTFNGGCIGFMRTWLDHDFHLGFDSNISVNLNHYVLSDLGEEWVQVRSGKSYDLSKYQYIWVGTYDQITVTQI